MQAQKNVTLFSLLYSVIKCREIHAKKVPVAPVLTGSPYTPIYISDFWL